MRIERLWENLYKRRIIWRIEGSHKKWTIGVWEIVVPTLYCSEWVGQLDVCIGLCAVLCFVTQPIRMIDFSLNNSSGC